tara:strand:- start:857 stop:982 length:126 start_codon:yes stop_codon:yes gene_type:complete
MLSILLLGIGSHPVIKIKTIRDIEKQICILSIIIYLTNKLV